MWRILVADDEAMERSALEEILREKLGCPVDVRCAADGQSAVEVATLWRADLILMDIEMPGMNGVRAAAAIRRALPDCEVIFLTAYGLFEYAQEAIRLGVREYLLKPAEDEEVLAAVRKSLAALKKKRTVTVADAEKRAAEKAEEKPGERPAEKPAQDKNARLMQQVQTYLDASFAQDVSLDSLAETLGFSPFYLSKLFKQHLGTSFIEYLTDLRVQRAKEYLADPTKSAKEVGEMVGYPSSNYFVKMFKKKTGVSPTEYRNSL